MLPAQLLAELGRMLPSAAGAGGPWGAAGEAADQAKALGQSRRAGRLLLQQLEACLHHLGLTETEGLAQAVEPGLAAVTQAHGNRPHRISLVVIQQKYRGQDGGRLPVSRNVASPGTAGGALPPWHRRRQPEAAVAYSGWHEQVDRQARVQRLDSHRAGQDDEDQVERGKQAERSVGAVVVTASIETQAEVLSSP